MRRARSRPATITVLRGILAGTLLVGAIGSCELPKPRIPSIGDVAPAWTATADPAAAAPIPVANAAPAGGAPAPAVAAVPAP